MYGPNVEDIIEAINNIKNETRLQIQLLVEEADHRLIMIKHTHNVNVVNSPIDGAHGHGSGDHGHNFWLQGNSPPSGQGNTNKVSDQLTYADDAAEDRHDHTPPHIDIDVVMEKEEIHVTADQFVAPIAALMTTFAAGDLKQVKEIDQKNYVDIGEFNNRIKSPWQEMYDLETMVDDLKKYAGKYPTLQWIGEKHGLLHMMQRVFTTAVDAKWAIQVHHDWIQRAYDNLKNNNIASVPREHFTDGASTGQVKQEVKTNADVYREDPSTPDWYR